jgi:hypothetical protein
MDAKMDAKTKADLPLIKSNEATGALGLRGSSTSRRGRYCNLTAVLRQRTISSTKASVRSIRRVHLATSLPYQRRRQWGTAPVY